MNIIKEGYLHDFSNDFYHGECRYCGAIIECQSKECIITNGVLHSIKCPTENCGNIIALKIGRYYLPKREKSIIYRLSRLFRTN
jgi:hypothetical protein